MDANPLVDACEEAADVLFKYGKFNVIKKGSLLQVVDARHGHAFTIGDIVTVEAIDISPEDWDEVPIDSTYYTCAMKDKDGEILELCNLWPEEFIVYKY